MKLHIWKYLLFLLIGIMLFGCKRPNSETENEDILIKLTARFPQLPKGKGALTDFYKPIRTVICGNNDFKIQLFATPDSIEDRQEILIISNIKGMNYAIPLFSNTYRDYWDFQFDTPIQSVKKTGTTFEKEFLYALEYLSLNDTLGTANKVIANLFNSILFCKLISDSISYPITHLIENSAIPIEDRDSCDLRLCEIQKVINRIQKVRTLRLYCILYDYNRGRYYFIEDKSDNNKMKMQLKFKTYRVDCNSFVRL